MDMEIDKNQKGTYTFIRQYLYVISHLLVILHKIKVIYDEYDLVVDMLVVGVWYIMSIYWYYSRCGRHHKNTAFLDFDLNYVCNLSM